MDNTLNILDKLKQRLKRSRQNFGSRLGKQPPHYPVCMGIFTALSTSLLFVYLSTTGTAAFVQSNIVRGLANLNPLEIHADQGPAQLLLKSPWNSSINTTHKDFENKVVSFWGDEANDTDVIIAYAQNPKSRGVVNFHDGIVSIETIDGEMAITRLREAIVSTMQGIYDGSVNLSEEAQIFADALAFLYETDQEYAMAGMSWQNDPQAVAEMLLKNCLVSRTTMINGKETVVQGVALPLPNPTALRAGSYQKHINEYAEKYNLTSSLVYAIMHTESNFNPHAVSTSKALGLMQIVPETAGQEAHAYLTGKKIIPSIDTLLTPEDNIKYGTTYIYLLGNNYFGKVTNSKARRLCVIAAYNAGPGAVLRTFANMSSDGENAIDTINSMTAEEVYKVLVTKMPSAETRRYVEVVTKHMLTYQGKV